MWVKYTLQENGILPGLANYTFRIIDFPDAELQSKVKGVALLRQIRLNAGMGWKLFCDDLILMAILIILK